jgi:hypothetical protein
MLVRIFLCRNGEHSVGANSPQDKDSALSSPTWPDYPQQ